MGAWGVGVREDDFVCDVEGAFKDQLKDGKSLADATASVLEQYANVINDADDGPLLWIALADMQWTYGRLDPVVLRRVADIVDSDAGMERWGDPSDKIYKQRKAVLTKFHHKLTHPNPKPSRPLKRVSHKPKFIAGDCLSITLKNGKYGAALVLATDNSNPEQPTDLVAELDYLSDVPPSKEVFSQRNWLKLTHHNWDGKLSILWFYSIGFRKMKSRISVIGNIPIIPTDPQQSSLFAGWHVLGTQIIDQYEWDTEQNAKK